MSRCPRREYIAADKIYYDHLKSCHVCKSETPDECSIGQELSSAAADLWYEQLQASCPMLQCPGGKTQLKDCPGIAENTC